MNDPTAVPGGLRQAALALHALAPADREWMLRALPAHQGLALEPLLRELKELGFPPGAADLMLAEAVPAAEPHATQTHGLAGPLGGDRAGLCDVPVPMLAGVLCTEPPRLIALLLAAQPKGKQQSVLAALSPPLSTAVRQHVAAAAVPPALCAAIARAVQGRIDADHAAPAERRSWRRLLAWRRK